VSAGAGAEVGIDLAGDVTLQAADDFLLGFPFGCAALICPELSGQLIYG
jgi:hypothetical protein